MTRALLAFVFWLLADLFVRSIDYLTGNPHSAGIADDNLFMPEAWGVAALAACLIVVLGLARRSMRIVQFGSTVAFSVYVMFAVQVFEMRMLPYPWPPEDTRLVMSHVASAGMWLTVAVTLWYRRYANKRCREELGIEVRGG